MERLAGELSAAQEHECCVHEEGCATCRFELNSLRQVEHMVRASWPSEDAPALRLMPVQTPARNWFDVAGLWFGRASTALVAACLLAMVLLRPSIQLERQGVWLAFGTSAPQVAGPTASPVTAEQTKAWVQAAVDERAALLRAQMQPVGRGSIQDEKHAEQLNMRLQLLEKSQAFFWQQLQQQSVYLESLWRNSAEQIRPARYTTDR
jgi:hypothetical protein